VSDIATNLTRGPLIVYTQEKARYYGIRLTPGITSGPLWNPETHQFGSRFVELPVTSVGKLLVVPKIIVRRRMVGAVVGALVGTDIAEPPRCSPFNVGGRDGRRA
jgi:hypothetical protein